MTIPQAVLEAEKEAEAAAEEYDKAVQEAEGIPVEPIEVPIDADEPTEPEPDEPLVQTPEPNKPVNEPVAEGTPETEKALEKAKARYDTLLGKYNKEVPRFQEAMARMEGELNALKATKAAEPAAPKPEPVEVNPLKYLKDQEIEDFGADLVDMHARIAKGTSEAEVAKSAAELRETQAQLEDRIAQLEREKVSSAGNDLWDRVESQFPGAKKINDSDPLWHDFLAGTDPVSGISYRKIGQTAMGIGDVSRIVGLLSTYAEEAGLETDTLEAPEDEAPAAEPVVKPKKSRGGKKPTQPKEKPVYTEAQVTQYYENVARGRFKGKEKEAEAIEREIELAMEEGRIR